ncbi:dihydrolipoyl dehydrogenase [Aerococcus urinae]
MMINTDLVVLGGGPAGYVAAIQAAKLGLEVYLIEEDRVGGTCLNRGCIPTKALLQAAHVKDTVDQAQDFGIETGGQSQVKMEKIQSYKNAVVKQLVTGVAGLVKKNKVHLLKGHGAVLGPSIFSPNSGAIAVSPNDPEEEESIIVPKNVIIATGSRNKNLPNITIDEEYILSSTGLLEIAEIPKSIAIIGGGVIGVEFASFLARMGSQVTIIEYLDRLLGNEGKNISQALAKNFKKQGIKLKLSCQVDQAQVKDGQVLVSMNQGQDQEVFDKVLVAVGREPNIDNIGLHNTSIKYDKKGIEVNRNFQTKEGHIYAIGDAINTLQLAHVAMAEAKCAVDHIVKKSSDPLNYTMLPRCVYSSPEIASVGYNQDDLPEGVEAKVGHFPLAGNGKALIEQASDGFIEVIRDQATDDLLGITILGPHASEMISEGSLGLYLNAANEEVATTVHPHPSFSEALQEAALDAMEMAIHK